MMCIIISKDNLEYPPPHSPSKGGSFEIPTKNNF